MKRVRLCDCKGDLAGTTVTMISRRNNNNMLRHLCRVIKRPVGNTTTGVKTTAIHGYCTEQHPRVTAVDTASEKVIVRYATEADFEGVCTVSRLAHKDQYKTDYMPGWFHRVIKDDNRIVCVAEKNGQIIGSAMGLGGVDNGRTIMGEAVRIRPDVDGTGLLGRCLHFIVSECVQRWPNFERLRSSSLITDYFDKVTDKVDILSKRVYIEISLSASRLENYSVKSLRTHSPVPTRRLSNDEFTRILADEITTGKLYPQGLISVGYYVFDAQPCNVPFITYFHENVHISEDERSISVGGKFPCNDGLAWRYNFNYSGRVDINSCLAHLVEHLKRYVASADGKDVYVIMSIPKSFKNLFGRDTIHYCIKQSLDIGRADVVVRTQYQYV